MPLPHHIGSKCRQKWNSGQQLATAHEFSAEVLRWQSYGQKGWKSKHWNHFILQAKQLLAWWCLFPCIQKYLMWYMIWCRNWIIDIFPSCLLPTPGPYMSVVCTRTVYRFHWTCLTWHWWPANWQIKFLNAPWKLSISTVNKSWSLEKIWKHCVHLTYHRWWCVRQPLDQRSDHWSLDQPCHPASSLECGTHFHSHSQCPDSSLQALPLEGTYVWLCSGTFERLKLSTPRSS